MAREHYETLQQVFDDAYTGLAAQDFAQSLIPYPNPLEGCAYRGSNGLRCAIGHCIPDSFYVPAIEGSVPSCVGSDERYAVAQEVFASLFGDRISRADLTRLQEIHDEASDAEDMKCKLLAFAASHNLSAPDISSAA